MSLQIENLVLNNRDKIKSLLNIMPDEIINDNPYLQRATSRQKGCQIDYLIQTRPDSLYVCEIRYSRNPIKRSIIEEVEEKINRLKVPKRISIRPILIYLGEVHDEVLDANYFNRIINIEDLLVD